MEIPKNIKVIPFVCTNNPKLSFSLQIPLMDYEKQTIGNIIEKGKQECKQIQKKECVLIDFHPFFYQFDYEKPAEYYSDNLPFYFSLLDEKQQYVIIKTLPGEQIAITNIHEDDTIDQIKLLIQGKTGIQRDAQRLIFGGRQLDDNDTLKLCKINSKDTISLVQRLRGGGILFADISNKSGKKNIGLSTSAPQYRQCTSGLNIEGICKNKDCEAYNHQAICMKGLGVFDLVLDEDQVKCPLCQQYMEPLTCGFYGCQYTFAGIKKLSKQSPPEKIAIQQWMSASYNNYSYYDPRETGVANWIKLKIYTKEFNQKKEFLCGICQKYIKDDEKLHTEQKCQHKSHEECYSQLAQDIKQNFGCLLCTF